MMHRLARLYYAAARWPEFFAPALDLGLRLYLADVFFRSGLTKIKSWGATLYLFSDVYRVPWLDPGFAAYLATGAELCLPVLLAVGLFSRLAAAGLFILNLVAVISYHAELGEAGIAQHLHWGLLLAVLLAISRGRWSLDRRVEASSCGCGTEARGAHPGI